MEKTSLSRFTTFNLHPSIVYGLAVSIPFLLVCFWFITNRGYPIPDSANYLQTIFPAGQALKNGEILSALNTAYWARGWKVILLPVLICPFLAATNDVGLAVALCNLAIYLVFLIYTTKLLKIFLSDTASILSTWFVGTLPWVLVSAFQFMCELPFMAAGIASIYYLIQNNGFKSWRQSCFLGISLSAAFCIQPFVAAVGIGIVYLFFVVRSSRAGDIDRSSLLAATALSAIALTTPYFFDFWDTQRVWLLALFWMCLLALTFYFLPKKRSSHNFFAAHSIFLASFVLWFTPFFRNLYSWAFDCTFGACVTPDRIPIVTWADVYNWAGGNLLAFLVLTALYNLVSAVKSRKFLPPKLVDLLTISPLLFVSMLVASITRNRDPRYHFLGLTVLYILLMVLIAGRHLNRGKIMPALLLIAGLYHAYWITNMIVGTNQNLEHVPIYRSNPGVITYINLLPNGDEDLSRLPVPWLLHRLKAKKGVHVAVFMDGRIPFAQPEMLSLLFRENGTSTNLYLTNYGDEYLDGLDNPRWEQRGVNYVLLGFLRTQDPLMFRTWGANRRTGQKILDSWRNNKLIKMRLEVVDKIAPKGQNECFLLMKVLPAD